MSNGWLSPATLVSGWSAIAATAASWIAWRVYRWQRETDVPTISAHIVASVEPVLTILVIMAENRSGTPWLLERVRCKNTAIRFATEAGVTPEAANSAGQVSVDRFADTAQRGEIRMDVVVGSAGTTQGSIARTSTSLFFRVDPPLQQTSFRYA